jgi:hypothetical protein
MLAGLTALYPIVIQQASTLLSGDAAIAGLCPLVIVAVTC